MFRHAFLAVALFLVLGAPASADSIGSGSQQLPGSYMYSAAASPFEAFEWTPLDLAAFSAYGGDFANVRRPVERIMFFEDPLDAPVQQGPEDEQVALRFYSVAFFEELPAETFTDIAYDELPSSEQRAAEPVPEPGVLMLVGLGLLGASSRLRRAYRNR